MFDPVHLGVDENGEHVYVNLAERNMLLGGEPGAGKSSGLNLIVAHGALSYDCKLILTRRQAGRARPLAGQRRPATHRVEDELAVVGQRAVGDDEVQPARLACAGWPPTARCVRPG